MSNRSGQKSSSPLGRGCCLFGLGVATGIVALPLCIFLVFSVPSVQRLLGDAVTRFLKTRVVTTYERITTEPPAPREEGAGVARPARSGEYDQLLTYEGLRIRYRVTGPEMGSLPFIHGEVENAGTLTVQVLQLLVNIPETDAEGKILAYRSQPFEIMRETARAESEQLGPGTKKTFILHPDSAPPGWRPDNVRVKVKDVKYLN